MTNAPKPALDFSRYLRLVNASEPYLALGAVTEMVGLLIESSRPATALGDFCEIETAQGRIVRVQVIGFRNGRVLSMPLEETGGIQLGDKIVARPVAALVKCGPGLLGRVLDGFGDPMEGAPLSGEKELYDLFAVTPGPPEPRRMRTRVCPGVRS